MKQNYLWKTQDLKKPHNLNHPLLKDSGTVSSVLSWQNGTTTMWFFPDVGKQKHMESIWISVDINSVYSFYLFMYVYTYLFIYLLLVPAAALSWGQVL